MDFDQLAKRNGFLADTAQFAQWLDSLDPLAEMQSKFEKPSFEGLEHIAHLDVVPVNDRSVKHVTYLCGNSMGLKPKNVHELLHIVLQQWGKLGVHAYHRGPLPASHCDIQLTKDIAELIVGAEPDEVAITGGLSTNIHLLFSSFYRPHGVKTCILIEAGAFPSDYYVVESQISWHGLNPSRCIIQIKPRPGEWCLRTEDVIQKIREEAEKLALIWLPGVQYFTGQLFDMEQITQAGHQYANCPVGWDLAHAVGNVPLELHKWNVDMAAWCSYKYLNGSPGAIAGLFVHRKHHHQAGLHGPSVAIAGVIPKGPQLTGWWSHRAETRFDMTCHMELEVGAAAYRITNPPLLLAAALRASIDLFRDSGGMSVIREKSIKLTGYLDYLLRSSKFALPADRFQIITPKDPTARGAQVTIFVSHKLQQIHERLSREGFIYDIRHPKSMRIAPAPLYNSFLDIFHFAQRLSEINAKID
ncbi:kynureninase [Paragonimus westermani]|uniref:Kynureninase n=1 Tax=Paragonimus westermani TaxID=34504 RepID=A0A5J4NKJ3_9TREM|nr:kynureninase [Paragonimus westermani]